MYLILWEYQVKAGQREEFEKHYSSNGSWVSLFVQGEGYLGTELLQDENVPNRYLTIDRWTSKESHEAFMGKWEQEYKALDAQCDGLTENETKVGTFYSNNTPAET